MNFGTVAGCNQILIGLGNLVWRLLSYQRVQDSKTRGVRMPSRKVLPGQARLPPVHGTGEAGGVHEGSCGEDVFAVPVEAAQEVANALVRGVVGILNFRRSFCGSSEEVMVK